MKQKPQDRAAQLQVTPVRYSGLDGVMAVTVAVLTYSYVAQQLLEFKDTPRRAWEAILSSRLVLVPALLTFAPEL